jgi:hypothetical protein
MPIEIRELVTMTKIKTVHKNVNTKRSSYKFLTSTSTIKNEKPLQHEN